LTTPRPAPDRSTGATGVQPMESGTFIGNTLEHLVVRDTGGDSSHTAADQDNATTKPVVPAWSKQASKKPAVRISVRRV
jgi:hypothetical protein